MKKEILLFLISFTVLSSISALAQGTISSHAAVQGILLTVNIANPSAVVIMSTGQNASTNNSTTTAADGVLLAGFFSANTEVSGSMSGSLTGGGSGVTYSSYASDTFNGPSSGAPLGDLDLFSFGSGSAQTFSTANSAFTGSVAIDFSTLAANLSGSGTIGYIYAGNGGANGTSGNLGPIIGEWIAIDLVPEPGATALLALGVLGAGLMFYRRQRLV